ncbi:MAG: DnaB-like helicase C-terminal domain-containing protein, partial [Cyanobacteria bacterium P01_D01_bin.116]
MDRLNYQVIKNPNIATEEEPICALEIEATVLGEILSDAGAAALVRERVAPEHFSSICNRNIYEAVISLFDRGSPIDIMLVCEELKKRGTLKKVGGIPYVLGLTENIISTKNIEHHVGILLEYYLRRQLNRISKEASHNAKNPRIAALEAIFSLQQKASNLEKVVFNKNLVSVETLIPQVLEEIKGGEQCISTGYPSLDAIFDGYKNGNLVVLAAHPGMGKTGLLVNLIREQMDLGNPTAFFSLEMSKLEISKRLISLSTGIEQDRLKQGKITEQEDKLIREKLSKNLYLDDSPMLEIGYLKARCRSLVANYGVKIVFVDYLQIMTVANISKNAIREQVVAAICRGLKEIAKELKITVVVAAQLNRSSSLR